MVIAICVISCIADVASAQFGLPQQQRHTAEDRVTVRLLADTTAIQPGSTFHLVALFDIEESWHIYWHNPGDGAAPTSIDLSVPDGFELGEPRWSRPTRTDSAFGDVFAYTGQAAVFFPVTAPRDLDDDSAAFRARIAFAVCDARMCLFGDLTRGTSVPVSTGTGSDRDLPARADTIARHLERLPQPITEVDGASVDLRDRSALIIAAPIPQTASDDDPIAFYPIDSPGVEYDVASIQMRDGNFTMTIDLDVQPHNFLDGLPTIGGLVAFGEDSGGPSYEVRLSLSSEILLKE